MCPDTWRGPRSNSAPDGCRNIEMRLAAARPEEQAFREPARGPRLHSGVQRLGYQSGHDVQSSSKDLDASSMERRRLCAPAGVQHQGPSLGRPEVRVDSAGGLRGTRLASDDIAQDQPRFLVHEAPVVRHPWHGGRVDRDASPRDGARRDRGRQGQVCGGPLFRDFADEFTRRQSRCWKPATRDSNRTALNNQILPFFGDMRLADIDRADVARWFDSLSATPAMPTARSRCSPSC